MPTTLDEIRARWLRLRLRLAQAIAPAGADVHDPDETACPQDLPVLAAVEAYELYPDPDDRVRLDVTGTVRDAEWAGWISLVRDHDDCPVYALTGAGAATLARLRPASRVQGTEDAETRQPRPPQEHDHSVRLDGSGCPACGYVTSMVPAGQDRHA